MKKVPPAVAKAEKYTRKRSTPIKDGQLQAAEESSYHSDKMRLRAQYDRHFATGRQADTELNRLLWYRDRYYAVLDAMIAAQATDLSDGTFDRYLAEEAALRAELNRMGMSMKELRERFFVAA